MPVTAKNQTAICGWSVLGYEILGETWRPHGRPATEAPLLHVFNASFTYVGRIDDYETFSWVYNWYDADTFEFTINRYKTNVSQLVADGFVAFQDEGDQWHVGVIKSIAKPLNRTVKVQKRGRLLANHTRVFSKTAYVLAELR